MEIHLLGPLPPPYGGVSVHIQRLRALLEAAGHQCTVWGPEDRPAQNMRRLERPPAGLRQLAGIDRKAIVHFHEYHLHAGWLAQRHPRVLYTVHNERINHTLGGGRFLRQWLARRVQRYYFRKVRHLITVSERAKRELVRFGFDAATIDVTNAYLVPSANEVAHPANVAAFESFRARYSTIATANAWALNFFQGADLYGIDMCLELVHALQDKHPGLGIALAIPLGRGTAYLEALQRRAAELGVSERVLWLLEPGAYHPILQQCDLFLRPTNTDGFSVSIAEAFEYGVPVIASDAVTRPAGCVEFRTRDVDDFVATVDRALADLAALAERSRAAREPDHFGEILAVYERLAC